MGGRAVEGTGLENRQGCKPLVGSNPTPSASSLGNNQLRSIAYFFNRSSGTISKVASCVAVSRTLGAMPASNASFQRAAQQAPAVARLQSRETGGRDRGR